MSAIAKRLRDKGHVVRSFSYPTRNNTLEGHADELRVFIGQPDVARLHLVGHSMGGLVILKMLSRYDDLPPGRIVLMGTPVKGSQVVKRMEILPGHKVMFGKAREDLLKGFAQAPREHQTGMISGTRPVGLGRIVGSPDEPSDGTVAVSETNLEGLKDRIKMPVGHSGLLLSADVVEQLEQFLIHGSFNHG
jgi:pimeloyl-ACP methyl ester carboxylesterase